MNNSPRLFWLEHAIAEIKGSRASITPETKLVDLGLDSLDTVELMMMYEDDFGVTLSDDETTSVVTVRDLLNLFQ